MPAIVAGFAETMRARSRFWPLFEPLPVPSFLMSEKTPLAVKPAGATIDPVISLKNFFIKCERICEGHGAISNLYRINFQAHHADMNPVFRVRRMFGDVTPRDGG